MPNDQFDRRTLLAGLAGATLWAADASFPEDQEAVLKSLAFLVLPASLGRAKTDELAMKFVRWVRGYTPGAEMEHGYGFTRIESRPPSPGPKYVEQLRALAAKGVSPVSVDDALKDVKALPRVPAGQNVVADLMSFYFFSAEALDRCYDADIRVDACRGFTRVGESPARLRSKV